jgi:MraZ protein
MSEWLEFERRLAELPQFDPTVTTLRRIYVSGAVECDLDKLGRLIVPQSLRKHASLGTHALWAGMGKHVELWALDAFLSIQTDVLSDQKTRDEMTRRLAELGL